LDGWLDWDLTTLSVQLWLSFQRSTWLSLLSCYLPAKDRKYRRLRNSRTGQCGTGQNDVKKEMWHK